MTLKKEILFEQVKNSTTKVISLMDVIEEQHKKLSDIRRRSEPSKAAKAYVEEEEQKLLFLQDIIKRALWDAYVNDSNIVNDTLNWSKVLQNFEIEVIAKRKETKL
jgi:hypothetical protein